MSIHLERVCAIGSLLIFLACQSSIADDTSNPEPAKEMKAPDESKRLTWHQDLETAITEARRRGKPVLVRAGAKWCLWCRKLETEIAKPDMRKELANWVLLEIDTDENPDDARRLNIGPIPALRILGPDGRTTSARDGYQTASELLAWLGSRGDDPDGDVEIDVKEISELNADSVSRLVRQLNHRDANVREAVIRRLSTDKGLASAEVVDAFIKGNLATRLAALELLAIWKAPLQNVDPWQPATVTEALFENLKTWAGEQANVSQTLSPDSEPLTTEQLMDARTEITKFINAEMTEAEAIGARLARIGSPLLPEVREQRQQAESDKIRARLDWLRFRLIATDSLVLKWPGGLERLASTDARTRRDAASELAEMATGGDESLLIELFSHPDPFVRELSLKALHGVEGTRADAELSRLLVDPEPNVRAAVLKQLSEKPSPKLVPQIAAYVVGEKDPDLVVHAVRLLRAIKGKDAVECLISQLAHANWQVRAETVDALGEIVSKNNHSSYGASNSKRDAVDADAYTAILEVLPDQDSFVVSRAVNALKASDFALAAEPLAKSAEQHPELAGEISKALTSGQNIRRKGLPFLRKWLTHENERMRASAISAIFGGTASNDEDAYEFDDNPNPDGQPATISKRDGETVLIPALSDPSERVRLAAATQLLMYCKRQCPKEATITPNRRGVGIEIDAADSPTLFESVAKLFTKFGGKASTVTIDAVDVTADAIVVTTDDVEETNKANKVTTETSDKTADLHPFEAWLTNFRSGQGRKEWINRGIEPLSVMLNSQSVPEQIAAGVLLVALGEDARAMPVLTKIVAAQVSQSTAVAKALGWLPWEQRIAFFELLRQQVREPDQLLAICIDLVALRDVRASETLWSVLAGEHVNIKLAHSVFENLKKNYRIADQYADRPPKPIGVDVDSVKRFAWEGETWQQRVALAILLLVDDSIAADAAKAVYENPQRSAAIRRDAFCVLLVASDKKESQRLAVLEMVTPESAVIESALAYLTLGENAVRSIAESEFPLESRRNRGFSRNDNENELPKDLSANTVRPLLASPDEDVAAQAAFLLAMLGESDGMDRLIARWRKAGVKDSQWQKLVYEAIAVSDDPKHVLILDEIYRSMANRPYLVRDLYWKIRTMHGPEALKLRKRIRDEVGMDILR